jgi:hypothetical protein
MSDDFSVTCIIHIVYATQAACQKMGHDRSKYGSITIKDPEFMKNKEAFIGMVIKGAEELYDRLGQGGPNGVQGADDTESHPGGSTD